MKHSEHSTREGVDPIEEYVQYMTSKERNREVWRERMLGVAILILVMVLLYVAGN